MSRNKRLLALLLGLFVAACTAVKPIGFVGKEDGFRIKVGEDRIGVPIGGVSRLKLTIARSEYFRNKPIWITVQTELPPGVIATVTTNPVLSDTTSVLLTATNGASKTDKHIVISGDAKTTGHARKGTVVRLTVGESSVGEPDATVKE